MASDEKDHPAAEAAAVPAKIGGWLYLPAFGLVLGCINHAVLLLACTGVARVPADRWALGSTEEQIARGHLIRTTILIYTALQAGLLGLVIYGTIRFFKKKRNTPSALIALLLAQALVYGSLFVIAVKIHEVSDNAVIAIAGVLLSAMVWIPYLLVSKRVKRTFVLD